MKRSLSGSGSGQKPMKRSAARIPRVRGASVPPPTSNQPDVGIQAGGKKFDDDEEFGFIEMRKVATLPTRQHKELIHGRTSKTV